MKQETLYSPKILIIGIIFLIAKYLLDFRLSGSLSVRTYFDRNYFFIIAVPSYVIDYISYKKILNIMK